MPVVHVVERIDADRADQKIETVDVSARYIPEDVGLKDHLIVFVEIVCSRSVYALNDAAAVAVLFVLDRVRHRFR